MTDPQSRLDRLRDANEQLVVGAMRAQDLADHAEARLAERLRFETLESEIATVCATASAEHIDDRIRDCLRRVVTFLGVDRGALAQPSSDLTVSVTHFWGLDGVVPPPLTIDLRAFPYFRSRMEAGQGWMTFERPDDLPPEAAAERAALETLGIRSFAAISLHADDRWLGFLAFVSQGAERAWPDDFVGQLRTLAEHFSHALVRAQSAAALESSAALTSAVLAALPGETAIIDADGTILQTNEAWAAAARNEPRVQQALTVGSNYLDACRDALDMPRDLARRAHASVQAILAGEHDEFVLE